MQIVIYRYKSGEKQNKIYMVDDIAPKKLYPPKLTEIMLAYNANEKNEHSVELHKCTDLECWLLKKTNRKDFVDKEWLNHIESLCGDALDQIRQLQRHVGDGGE